MSDSLDRLFSLLDKNSQAAIILPAPLDIDAIASSLSLATVLNQREVEVRIYSESPVNDYLRVLIGEMPIYKEYYPVQEIVILVDCPTSRHVSFFSEIQKSQAIVLIDHHPKSDLHRIANLIFWNEEWSATAQGLFQLFKDQRQITSQIATWMLLAIMADTGSLQHKTKPETFQTASQLLSLGANLNYINGFLHQYSRSINQLRLWGKICQNIRLIEEWDLSLALVRQEDLLSLNSGEGEVFGVVNWLADAAISSIVMLVIEDQSGIRGLIRSRNREVNAGKLAQLFGGNGFDRAAGFSIPGKFVKKDSRVVIE